MKRRLTGTLAVLLVLSLLIMACGPEPVPTRSPEPTVIISEGSGTGGKVTLWHAWGERATESLYEVVAAFRARNPDVQFEVLYIPHDDLRDEYEEAAITGGGPSVLVGAADWGPALFDAGLVSDVRSLADSQFLGTFNQAALGAVRYKDALVGLPHTIRGVVMYRNRDIIADAPLTFEELLSAAQAATTGDTVGASLERGFFFSGAHLNGVGGLLMDDEGNPLFNDDKGVEWLDLLNSFSEVGPAVHYAESDATLFRDGKAGIIIDSTWNAAGFAEAIGTDKLAIDPWPSPMSGYVQTENIYLSANAEDTEEEVAWAFMEFFLSPEAQAILADSTKAGHLPAVIGVEIADPLLAQAAEALASGTTLPVIPEMGAYWGPMEASLQSVFDEGADPAAALNQAYNSVVAGVSELRGEALPQETLTGTVTVWHSWQQSELVSLNEVVAAFQEQHEDVQFQVLYVDPDDLLRRYRSAAASGGPSVLMGAAGWGPGLFDAGLVADVRGFTTTPLLATINQAALDAVTYKGALVGLPGTIEGVVLFRNSAIIPEAPATYEDLVAAAQVATHDDVSGAVLERGFLFSAAHLEGIGGQLMDDDGNPMFNSDKGVEWLNLLDSFTDAGPAEFNTDNDLDLFKAGKAGIIIGSTLDTSGLADAIGSDKLVIDPWPTFGGEGRLSGYVQAENIYLNGNVEAGEQAVAWAFMEFLLSPEAQAILADPTKAGRIPAITGVEVGDLHIRQSLDALSGGTVFPANPEMDLYWEPMEGALQSVFDEGTDPREALGIAYDVIVAAIEEIRGGQ